MQFLRGVPGLRGLKQSLLTQWQSVRPIPTPAYKEGTPQALGTGVFERFFPPNGATLGEAAMSSEAKAFVNTVLSKLTPTHDTDRQRYFYEVGVGKFGPYWRNADVLTAVRAAAMMIRPNAYLEIGVHRGRSVSVVGASCPQCAIYGFDLWIEGYGGIENPGPDFVRNELSAAGHAGPVELISGDSGATVPEFLRRNPDLNFDLITVDGDHSVRGAATDLASVLPRLKVGGALVFDDLVIHPLLQHVWRRIVEEDDRYTSWRFTDSGAGVGIAVRISDGPVPARGLASVSSP